MKLQIKGYEPSSFIEWPGKIVAILFTAGCNFRCPYCQNRSLITNTNKLPNLDINNIFNHLESRKKWIDAVEITGGEPTIHSWLPELLKKIKKAGFLTKVDTNGTNPKMLKELINKKLVDYIAMDIKAPLEKYEEVCKSKVDLNAIKESISLLLASNVDYEFRTTVVPALLSASDIERIAKQIQGAKRYYIQQFVARNTLDSSFEKEVSYPIAELKEMVSLAKKYIQKVELRGV